MTRTLKTSVSILSACLTMLAQQTTKSRIVIKTFENPASYHKSTVGDALTEIFITELSQTNKYSILDGLPSMSS